MAIEQNEAQNLPQVRDGHDQLTAARRSADAVGREFAAACPLAEVVMVERERRSTLMADAPPECKGSVPGRAEGLGSRLHTYWSPRPKELTS